MLCRVVAGGTVSAYVIYEAEIIDPVRYEDYRAKTAASLAAAGAVHRDPEQADLHIGHRLADA